MATEKKFGCIIYEDVFDRMDKTFNDEQLGRILRSALNYGFHAVIPELESPFEQYACSELQSIFDRNRESYVDASKSGSIGSAIRHAKTIDELDDRLASIDGITNFQIHEARKKWQEQHK